ncbi:hypothetical protein PV08_10895 [Exophiala spinifera]|uniref:Uncharacterized protein n=1 Tax=Exophiala spinifera TaxID=91928 RepID=A0A0D2BJZ8_9EURO|nr:uncharacterized protein PV08_10895 [Exophiala spinifera]KIW11594.1 hypothetical protein PV08_10895 [Exophiala spinifera]
MAAMKTFILAPNFSFSPDTSICMGDIVQDPSDPTRPLSSSPRAELETATHTDYDAELTKSASTGVGGGVWATFLQGVASLKLYGEVKKETATSYTIDRLETVYFKRQPTDEQASRWTLEPRVAAAIDAGLVRKKPVYLVSGLKIARGFRLSRGASSSSHRAGVGAEAPVAALTGGGVVGVGADVDVERARSEEQSWRSDEDVVFAYQLHVIAQKGWRRENTKGKNRRADVRVYKSKAAFLSEDAAEEEKENPIAVAEMGGVGGDTEALHDVFGAERLRSVVTVTDGEDVVRCIVLDDMAVEEEDHEEEEEEDEEEKEKEKNDDDDDDDEMSE